MSKKRQLRYFLIPILCLCLFWGMGITANASDSVPETRFIIMISPPSDQQIQPAPVTIKVEDVSGIGFSDAQVKLGEDGGWHNITDSLRQNGWAHFEITRSDRVYVSVTDNTGIAHVSSRFIEFTGEAAPTTTTQSEQPDIPDFTPDTNATATEPTEPTEPVVPAAPTAPAVPQSPGNISVTPIDGTGTVIENSIHTPEVREFFTITTQRGGVFYLVVDRARPDGNVYLLSEVTEEDLRGFVREDETEVSEPPTSPPVFVPPVVQPEVPVVQPQPEVPIVQPEPQSPVSSDNSVVLIIIVALAIGGAGYYFKIVRPKQKGQDPFDDDDEDDEDDYGDDDSDSSDDEIYEYEDDGQGDDEREE